MNLLQTYHINTPTVVAEAFENETVIIHLESGTYYSLDQSGALIWQLLQQGASIADIGASIGASYGILPEALNEAVYQFIEDLSTEKLIIADKPIAERSHQPDTKPLRGTSTGANPSFPPPHLHKYTDMQDLLLLDPIHDVTETGWPHVSTR